MNSLDGKIIDQDRLDHLLGLEDFTRADAEPHPINLVMGQVIQNINILGQPEVRYGSPITTVEDNFDKLLFQADSVMRTALHTFSLEDGRILRTQMSSMLPAILSEGEFEGQRLIACPGLVYRKEGPHHQMDIWLVKRTSIPFTEHDVARVINIISEELIPEEERILKSKSLCYISNGYKLKAQFQGRPQTFIDGGVVVPQVLANSGLRPDEYQAIAVGVSLDRLAMYKKDITDPRILRSKDPRVRSQMQDLTRYNSVSNFPSTNRDLSITVDSSIDLDDIEFIMNHYFDSTFLAAIESISILSSTDFDQLPEQARNRLGIQIGQKNILIRLSLRSFEKTLTKQEANGFRDNTMSLLNRLTREKVNEIKELYLEQ